MTEEYKKALARIQEAKAEQATRLDLSRLGLTELPAEIAELTQLRELNFSFNQVSDLSPIQGLINLNLLNFYRNKINGLSPIQELKNLNSLTLGGNQVSDLTHIQELKNLNKLQFSGNQVSDLSPIQELKNLNSLNFSENQVTDLSPIQGLTNLNSLHFSRNQVTDLSPIQELINLNSLNFSGNQVSELSPIQELKNLNSLDFSYNQVNDLSPIQGLTNLNSLHFSGNQVKELSPVQELKNLNSLNFSDNQVSELTHIQELIGLETLTFWRNQVSDLSPIQGLKNLNSLNFFGNQVEDLSPIQGLTGLNKLDFSFNQVFDLSPVQELANLNSLDFSENQVEDLSPIQGLKKLISLDFRNNQVNDLSPIQELINLIELYFSNNQVSNLSPIQELKKLETLDISNNKINCLPEWLLQHNKPIIWPDEEEDYYYPDHIIVTNNPFTEPPTEIVRQGNKAIKKYYQNARQRLGEIKIILVGQGTAGKTSIIRRLLDNEFDPNETQTHGIKIRVEDLSAHGQATTGRFWDFGGQEIMHATHKFFLSERSIYVLVLDSRKDENPDYWLRHIETQGGGKQAQALILFNKSDENPTFDLDRKALRDKYPFIKGFIPVSAKTGDGIEDFRKALFDLIAGHPLAESKYPEKWLAVKAALEAEKKRDYIGYDYFRQICARKGVRSADDQEYLLRALNDLGVALHFENLRGFNTQVLNPLWLTNAVYRIVNAPLVGEERGLLRIAQVGDMLNDPRYGGEKFEFPQEKWPFIVRIMEEFELCYEVRREAEYIVPERLPAAGEENVPLPAYGKSLRLLLKYPEFMPTSLFPRLMVRTHHLIRDTMRWRTAMQLEERDYFHARARIMADREDRSISIEVTGKDPRGFLSYLRKELEAIRKSSFSELKYEEYVPIEGRVSVKYETLLAHEKRNRKEYFCPELERDFSVAELLDGIEEAQMRSEEAQVPVTAFVSYAHADEDAYSALKEIKKHLMPQVRLGNVTLWDDGAIVPGEDWSQAIWRNFEQADIIICLLSPNFINSDFCYKKELEKALEAHEKDEKVIFPIRLQEFGSVGLPIEALQGSPSGWIYNDDKDNLRNDRMVEMANQFKAVLQVVKQRKLAQRQSGG